MDVHQAQYWKLNSLPLVPGLRHDLSNAAPISLVRERNCVPCRVQSGRSNHERGQEKRWGRCSPCVQRTVLPNPVCSLNWCKLSRRHPRSCGLLSLGSASTELFSMRPVSQALFPLPNEVSGRSPACLTLNASSLLIKEAQWARLFPEGVLRPHRKLDFGMTNRRQMAVCVQEA
jgi:hypothetical protein